MADTRIHRRLAITASLLASVAMVAGTSAVAWPTIRHFITPPTVTTDHPSLRAVAPGGATALTVPKGEAASSSGMAFLVPTGLSERSAIESFAAPGTLPVATLVLPAAEHEETAGGDLAMRNDADDSFFIDQYEDPEYRLGEPNRGQDGLVSSDESTLPVLVQPRITPPRLPRMDTSDMADQRNRLNGHWSVGKFR